MLNDLILVYEKFYEPLPGVHVCVCVCVCVCVRVGG